MNKQELLEGYKKEEQILIAKVLDKIDETKRKNKITNTDFLDGYQVKICEESLKRIGFENYMLFGGYDEAERKILIFYPEKLRDILNLEEFWKNKSIADKLAVIRIRLPNELKGEYTHKNYLGMLMKLGIERSKIGDILVQDIGADIIILPEISKFLINNLNQLTRLRKANLEQIEIQDIEVIENKKKEYNIIISALRLDNVIAELARTSRVKAKEIIMQERVFINFKNETKQTKLINEGDIITIRGKGRFKIKEILGNTQRGRYIVKIEKYV